MIRSLKKRPRSDTLVNERRGSPHSAGRIIYLTALVIFGVAILNYLFGDLVFLRANGLVLKDQTVIAPTFVARIQNIKVKEGQPVKEGQVLFQMQSLEMLERLADLSARRATLVAASVEFRIRSETVAALLPLAKKRDNEAARVVSKFDELSQAGLTTASSYDTALSANFNSQQDHVKLATQLKTLERELVTLAEARTVAETTLERLQEQYADGVVRAPVSGSIGVTVPAVGNVYKTGEPILSIYSGEPYILAYMPRRYMFSITTGQKVSVSNGHVAVKGVLTELLPVTDALAKEFQNTFKPTDRSRLAKIKLLEEAHFPLHEKVSISVRYF
jgi:multidrug resistance efflux pump